MIAAKTTSIVHTNAREAGLEVAEELVEQLGRMPQLIIAFASADMDPVQALAGLRAGLPDSRIVGCSSYAEINSHEALSGSLTAMGLCFEGIEFATFAQATGADPFDAGVSFAREVAGFQPNLLILFCDGLAYNSTRLLR